MTTTQRLQARRTAAPTNLRPALAQQLAQRLQAFREGFRHNVAVLGPPGSGKTFQCQQLLSQDQHPLLLIYCPLYRESCHSFLFRFLGAILQAEPTFDSLQLAAQTVGPKTAAAMAALEPVLRRRLFSEAFNRTLDLIPLVSAERQRPAVLILDEFLWLEDLGLGHAFHELGKRVMTWNSVLFMLTSSSTHRARRILRERLQLLFGQFHLVTLDPIEAATGAAWVQQELKGLRGARSLSPFLIRWLGGYPWYVGVFVKRLRELAAIQGAGELDESLLLHTAWDVIGSTEGALHQWCVSRTEGLSTQRGGPRALEILLHIANGARTSTDIAQRIGRSGLTAAQQLLVERDLAQRNGMCWVIPDPILRCWLSTVILSQRAGSASDASVRSAFDAYLRALWTQWLHTHALSFSQQVSELFRQFRDDTVLLDSKTGRLPAFDTIRALSHDTSQRSMYLVAEGSGKRWCASVHDGPTDEAAIHQFDAFCRQQQPRPARKVVITQRPMDEHTRVLAKSVNMWVWEPETVTALKELYGQL